MEKKKIEKGSVQETLLLPLYGRKRAMEMYPGNFNDLDCQRIYNEVEIDYNRKGIMEKIGAIMVPPDNMIGIRLPIVSQGSSKEPVL